MNSIRVPCLSFSWRDLSSLRSSQASFSILLCCSYHIFEVHFWSPSNPLSRFVLRMPELQLHLGGASFLLPNARTRLVSEASVNFSSEAASVNGSTFSLSSIIASEVWTSCKPGLSISLFVSFEGENLSTPLVSRRAFLMQLAKTLGQAEVGGCLQK